MRLDRFSNPILNEQDLFDALYQGFKPTSADTVIVDRTPEISKLEEFLNFNFVTPIDENEEITLSDFDKLLQSDWNMPEEYKNMDIEEFLNKQCPEENHQRLVDELEAYKARNMLDLLRWLKYFVDICSKEGIIWGVGRGSSVASYVLYLIGVHSIDPIKYNLDWQEFLR